MHAIRFHTHGGSDVLTYEQVDKPSCSADHVVVRIHAVGVNPVDTYIRTGTFGEMPLPHCPGMDAAGVVEHIGPDVSQFKEGDRVWVYHMQFGPDGTYAEYAAIPESSLHPLPDHLSFEQGAALGIPYLTAERALFTSLKGQPGDICLIHGASGGVGIAACQVARAMGMTVYGTASTPEGLDLVKSNGAHLAFDHSKTGYTDEIKAATGGKGLTLILEMLANVNLVHDIDMLASGGRINVIGTRGELMFNPGLFLSKEFSISGTRVLDATPAEVARYCQHMQAGMELGWLKPVVGKSFKLSEAGKAHDEIINGKAKGKMILLTNAS